MSQCIHAPTVTPPGAAASVHRLGGLRVSGSGASVTINSFADADNTMVLWQDEHAIPDEVFAGLTWPDGVLAWAISDSGPFPSGTLSDEADPIDSTRAALLALVNRQRDDQIGGGFTVANIGRFDTDDVSIRNIQGAVQAAALAIANAQEFSIAWRLADNATATLSAAQMVAVGLAVSGFVSAVYEVSWTLKAAIAAATTSEELAAIVIGGWPANE